MRLKGYSLQKSMVFLRNPFCIYLSACNLLLCVYLYKEIGFKKYPTVILLINSYAYKRALYWSWVFSGDQDQPSQNAASDQGCHYLPSGSLNEIVTSN